MQEPREVVERKEAWSSVELGAATLHQDLTDDQKLLFGKEIDPKDVKDWNVFGD